MKLNFSFNKAYEDLFSDKKYIWQLLSFSLIFVLLDLMQTALKSHSSSNIAGLMFAGYLSIMANNIIHDKEPVLADIYAGKDKKKNIFRAGFKNSMVQLIYFIVLGILGYFIVNFLGNNYGIKPMEGAIIVGLIFLPVIVFSLISAFILFSENLSFKESFNLIKSAKSFKYAWKEYLLSGALNIMNFIGLIITYTLLQKIFKNFYFTQISNLLMYSFLIIGSYFCSHFIAQAYKYSLSKMNPQESMV